MFRQIQRLLSSTFNSSFANPASRAIEQTSANRVRQLLINYNPIRALKDVVAGALELPGFSVAGVEGSGITILMASRPKDGEGRSAKGVVGGRGKSVKLDPSKPIKEKKLTYEDVETGVKSVLGRWADAPIGTVKNNKKLDSFGIKNDKNNRVAVDSLDVVNLIVMLEEEFNVEIPGEIEKRFINKTVQGLINGMAKLLGVKK
jgi:acyl carrier protein